MKKKKYIVNGQVYEIPDSESEAFLKDNPDAKVHYDINGTQYQIPHTESEAFENDMGLKKKEENGGKSQSEIPSITNDEQLPTVSLEDNNKKDAFQLAQEHEQLANATKEVSVPSSGKGGELLTTVPDDDKIKQADKLRDFSISNRGVDPVDLSQEVKGLDETDFGKQGFSKQELLNDRENNNQLYQRKLGRLKWEKGLDQSLSNSLINGDINKDQYDNINNAVQSSLNNASVGDYSQQRDNINTVASAIKKFGGSNSDELLKNYAVEVAKVYGNSYNNNFEKNATDSPESKYFNNDELLGYQYLKDIDPEKSQQYERLFIDPKSVKDLSPDEKKGYDHLKQTLEETGIGLQANAVKEELNNLSNIAKQNNGLSPEQLQKGTELQAKQDELYKKSNELDQKYPDRIENKVDDAMQEILGQKIGFLNYAGGKTGEAIKNTGQGIWEAVSEPFMSDASNKLRELGIMGQSLEENQVYHKTDENKNLQTDRLVVQPELQSQIDAIANDKSLSRDQKEQKLYPLLRQNTDKFGRVPIQGGKLNLSSSSILYGVTDIGTSLLPFVGLEAITGGGATAGAARKFLSTFTAAAATSFHDEYANAIQQGLPQSEAYKRAMGVTAINSFAMAGAGTADKIKEMAATSKSSASDIISKMSDEQIQKVLDDGTPKALKGLKERFKATPQMFAKGAKTGIEFEAAMTGAKEFQHQLYNTPIDREQNLKQSILGIANFGLMGAGLGQAGFKAPTELQKDGLLQMGSKPDDFLRVADEMKKNGQLSPAEYDHRKDLIEKSADAYLDIPKGKANGKPLSEVDKGEYIYNTVIKNEGNKAAKTLPPKQAEKAEHTAAVADHTLDLILLPKTDKQLQDRKGVLERKIEPKKDAEGKSIELPEKEMKDYKAELEAVNNQIEFNSRHEKQNQQPESTGTEETPITQDESIKPTEKESTPNEATTETVLPTEEADGNTTGVRHESLKKIADRMGLEQPERGTFLTPAEQTERGRQLLKGGADPFKIAKDFKEDGKVNADNISVARAYSEHLTKEAQKAMDTFGRNSKEFKEAQTKMKEWRDDVMKPMGTQAGGSMSALQGETDIDTGSYIATKAALEDKTGKPLTPQQDKAITELTGKVKALIEHNEKLEKQLVEATDKVLGSKTGKFEAKAKRLADKIMKSETPDWLKINDPNIKKQGIGEAEVKKLLADATINMGKLLDKGVEFSKAVKEAVEELIKVFGEDKRDEIENGFTEHFKDNQEPSKEEKNIKRLEKELEDLKQKKIKNSPEKREHSQREKDLQDEIMEEKKKLGLLPSKGVPDKPSPTLTAAEKNIKRLEGELEDLKSNIAKQSSPTRELTVREKELQEQIKNEKERMGLLSYKMEKPLTQQEQQENDAKELDILQSKFVDKKDNKFTKDESKEIWEYAKKNYIDKGVKYVDSIARTAKDIGLSIRQVAEAVTTSENKKQSNDTWKRQYDYRKGEAAVKQYIENQNQNPIAKIWRKATAVPRSIKTALHGHIFAGTHYPMGLVTPSQWGIYFKGIGQMWKSAYGETGKYEQAVRDLENDKNFIIAKKAGLENDPSHVGLDDYERSGKILGKLGQTGTRGFFGLKWTRQQMFNSYWDSLDSEDKTDKAAKSITWLVNNATGATNLKIPAAIREGLFSTGMEGARWGRLVRNPAEAATRGTRILADMAKGVKIKPEDKVFVKVWGSRVGQQLGTMTALLFLNAYIQSKINPKNPVNLTDPTKPDFFKLKAWDMDVDLSGGVLGAKNLLSTSAGYAIKDKSYKQEVGDIGGAGLKYIRGKLSPAYSDISEIPLGTDFNGNILPFSSKKVPEGKRKIGWTEYLTSKVSPIFIEQAVKNIYEGAENKGVPKSTTEKVVNGLIESALSFGYGVHTNTSSVEHIPSSAKSIKNYNDGGREITVEEYKNFESEREKEIDKRIADLKKKGDYDDLTDKQKSDAEKIIKTETTKEVKNNLFGEEPEEEKMKIDEDKMKIEAKKLEIQ